MGYQFAVSLNRVVTDEEIEALGKAGSTGFTATTIPHPLGDSDFTRVDIDTEGENLEEAIQAVLDAVGAVSDLQVNSLDVPPQPSGLPGDGESGLPGDGEAEDESGRMSALVEEVLAGDGAGQEQFAAVDAGRDTNGKAVEVGDRQG